MRGAITIEKLKEIIDTLPEPREWPVSRLQVPYSNRVEIEEKVPEDLPNTVQCNMLLFEKYQDTWQLVID